MATSTAHRLAESLRARRRQACILAACLATPVLTPAAARAQARDDSESHPFALLEGPSNEAKPVMPEDLPPPGPPGYFGDIGSHGRWWEIQSNTSLSADHDRIFAQRLMIARAFPLTSELSLVARVTMATDAMMAQGVYAIQGPIVSLGLRDQSESGSFAIEFGGRLIPNWGSPDDTLPAAQQLALGATRSSGVADDAQWLPLADTGAQIYAILHSQVDPFGPRGWTFVPGARYGGEASLLPMTVQSWLGPQTGFVGNVFLELYTLLPRLADHEANLCFGGHGDVSLSTIWPAGVPFPIVGNIFLAWSPEYWFSARIFSGLGGSPGSGQAFYGQYGFRLEAYLP